MINVLLCGASGKMGRVVADCIKNRNDLTVTAGIDIVTAQYSSFEIYQTINFFAAQGKKADVVIDFSHPSLLDGLLKYAISSNIPVVIASTGYSEEQVAAIKEASKQIPVFFTFNMSIGVNLLVDLARRAASVLGDQFDIEIIERHHNQKIDAPSGTAIMLANAINEERDNSYIYEYDRHSKRQKRAHNEIGIHAVRGGTIVGEHEVLFAGRDECISLSHSATSKEVFAVGAVNAAAFMSGKPAGLYSMADLLK